MVARFPSLLGRIERGEIHLSTLVPMRDHLTEECADELLDAASGKSKREVEELLARRAPRPDVPSKIRKLPLTEQARIEPLSAARYKVQLTASTELREKLERARDLMRHRNPSGDLAVVVERALDVLLEKLEKETQGKTIRPQRRGPVASAVKRGGHVTGATRRHVFERDGAQCTFVDAQGRRCPARTLLELDHVESRALGGPDDAANLRVLCRPHNSLHAEEVFGREHVARRIDFRRRKSRRPDAAPRPIQERSKTSHAAPAHELLDMASRGLVNMGFRETEARRALEVVSARRAAGGPGLPVQEILREALALLT